jgi:SAM-dependent methyltransferase
MTPSRTRIHWESVHGEKAPTELAWYQPSLATSLAMIESIGLGPDAAVIDVGGGSSTLADDLLARGLSDLTVLDISAGSLEASQRRLGSASGLVKWLTADITTVELPQRSVDLWHDRAVFHFLTNAADRRAYARTLMSALRPGGHVIVATFALDGPARCSGLDVVRYDPESLRHELGPGLEHVEHRLEIHRTPRGVDQAFVYCCLRKRSR